MSDPSDRALPVARNIRLALWAGDAALVVVAGSINYAASSRADSQALLARSLESDAGMSEVEHTAQHVLALDETAASICIRLRREHSNLIGYVSDDAQSPLQLRPT
jgi:hypothetical protein